jgi:hypothetical protein
MKEGAAWLSCRAMGSLLFLSKTQGKAQPRLSGWRLAVEKGLSPAFLRVEKNTEPTARPSTVCFFAAGRGPERPERRRSAATPGLSRQEAGDGGRPRPGTSRRRQRPSRRGPSGARKRSAYRYRSSRATRGGRSRTTCSSRGGGGQGCRQRCATGRQPDVPVGACTSRGRACNDPPRLIVPERTPALAFREMPGGKPMAL